MAARKGIKAGLALGAAVLALAACTLSASAAEGGKHINAALYWFGSSLDPAVEWDGWTTCRAGITETLVTVNENYEIVPLLADSWEQTDDTTWKMHIREGVTFHNGKAVDGEAVRKSFERAFSMQERAVTAAKIDTIEAEGQDVIFTTTEPFGAFLANISEPMYSVVDADADTDFASAPVATGPYRVTDFEVNTYIELEKYEDYWNGASDVDTITVRNIDDDSTRGMALQSGEMDVVQRVAWTDLPVFENDDSFAVYNTQGARTRILVFNYRNEMLQDINVRKAIIESINYDALVSVLGSGGWVVYGGVLGGIFGAWLWCRKYGWDFMKHLNTLIPCVALAQGFGRIGCFFAGCCYGIESNVLGVSFPVNSLCPVGHPVIPTQLIMSAGDFIIFALLYRNVEKGKHPENTGAMYLILYSVGRFMIEFIRGDINRGFVGVLSTSQFIALFVFLTGIYLLLRGKNKSEMNQSTQV